MSLLTNYEGLRHQIERLVRENEELKKLVRLIRENHELKSAIKTQAGGLGISGFSSGLGEAAANPAPRQGNYVFLPPSSAAANQPGLEDVGMVALAPLADMLSSPQPSPAMGSIVNPLTGQFSALLSGSVPMSQNNQLSSLLGSPMAVPPASTLASSLGLPSTSPLSSHLTSTVAVPPAGTLTSSLGLTSTGPLTPSSPMAVPPAGTLTTSFGLTSTGPLTPSSPVAVPPAGTLTSSLGLTSTGPLTPSSPLLAPTTVPLAVPQNLLANPMGNLVLSEPTRRCSSGRHPSAGSGPAAPSKVLMSAEHPRPSQDLQTHSVTFVGAPIQTSTPIGPTMAFSYGVSDPQTQPSAPQGQVVPGPVCDSSSACSTTPTPAPQAAAANHTSSSTTHIAHATTHSPTRALLTLNSPTPTSSSPASVNDARGSRTSETSRKSILDLERKLAHRKASKFPDSPRESKQLAWERLVGEIAFQLDRRILSSIFPERVRLYGFTVSNIPEKIIQASMNPNDHKLDEELCQTLTQRYVSIMNRLQSLGYNGRVHPALTEQLVNTYGILRERPELAASEGGSYTVDFLQRVLVETVPPSMLTDALLLLSCLSQLSHDDGKPMFIW
ncbi:speriolin [Loxodonta africana]|uniref:speriolin n=1 Tax=Loxodonta africana TaxID=9785 RepID=UPI000C8143A4|nr:speriolin [Loxodonta africana]